MSNFQCPSCGKASFRDQVAVARHMSQPRSGCSTWLQDLIHDLDGPNIPGGGPQAEVEFTFGDRDESFEGSGESGGQASEEGLLPNGASDFVDQYPESSRTYGMGYTFLDLFNSDENSVYRAKNPYYPFSGRKDWEIASWLLRSGLSMGKIDSFLSLDIIKGLPISFSSAKELRGRAEMLPSGPRWMSQVLSTSHPTKSPVILYWRDPLDCISAILNHPFFHDRLDFMPRRVYTTAQRLCRVYSEWMTGDDAWNMQSALPKGATLLGTILSSDKTNISTMTGDRVAHPLLTSSNSFVLTALLPIPKFIHKNKRMRGVLEDRLIHECLDIVLRPLKQAAREGVMLSDPLAVVQTRADPNDIEAFFREAQKFHLNGVSKPFWQDWTLGEPSHFLTPEFLHLIHREFYDHDVKWMICAVGDMEIDFRFSVLQPVTGFRHFYGGISKLKQRSIVAVSADAAPSAVITAVRALMEFRYLIQSPRIDEDDIKRISGALDEFHANKHAITAGGFRRGNKNKVIDNWYIPKLELMQSIVPSIRNTGVAMQWTADTTEHAHITEIKDPAQSSNNNNYDPQICRHLDRVDKCRRFDLAMSLVDGMASSRLQDDNIGDDILQHKEVGTVPLPLRTFVIGRTAYHLTYSPSIRSISINDAAIKFGLPDLRLAIADFLRREATHGQNYVHTIGGARRAGPTASLPFDKIQIWFKLRLQDTEFHDSSIIRPAQTLNCVPPSDVWNSGRYDSAIVNNESGCLWPAHGLRGHTIGQIRLIMRPVGRINTDWSWEDCFLVYMYRFDGTTSARDPATQLHSIRRAKRSNGTLVGDIIPLTQIKAPVNLIPRFGASADSRFTSQNSMEHASEFWVNKFWDKNTFFPLSM
ncbi:uncharacterized protein F5891DRAFT_1125768 [Suillus fuscotomentosus]|uniref:DUF6830 domain-containing protein n=1 Tax=Suillus fuscotomentosus TaxID=1912939 RepID=A0AAD4EGB0_9AGAM|nr:uncharacterized protein F5891DRAFT_1125768 [Suillus fuscotomentosus]KAG1905725.1 hypothetical protein F5891DRAFT_1125768 [Suillus fuscotomentosus]